MVEFLIITENVQVELLRTVVVLVFDVEQDKECLCSLEVP
jgi:hypothetical protein